MAAFGAAAERGVALLGQRRMNTKEEEWSELLTTAHTATTPRLNGRGLSLFRGRGYGIPVHSKGVPGMLPTTEIDAEDGPELLN